MKNTLAWLEGVLLIAPFAALVVLWNQIPARVPIHWNIRGEIDGSAPKTIGLLITPIIALLAVALCHVASWLDPKLGRNLEKSDRMNKVLQILPLAFTGFFDAVFAVQLAVAFGLEISGARAINSCILVLFVILGNYLPYVRPNYFIGIRTPWTLENPETWRATHWVGGRLMFFGALVLLVLQLFVSASASGILMVAFALLLVVWSLLYSWHHFRTHSATREAVRAANAIARA
jgi:uncharacterized membrane protein